MKKLLLLIALFCSYSAFADPGDPGGNPDVGTPIDGGVSLLVAGAIGYGVKKVKDARKKKNESENGKSN